MLNILKKHIEKTSKTIVKSKKLENLWHKIEVLSSILWRSITRNGDECLLTFTGFTQDKVPTASVSPSK